MSAKRAVNIGDKFGRWTILEEIEVEKIGVTTYRRFKVKCDCGVERIIRGQNLFNGESKSCGCFKLEKAATTKTKHGLRNARIYNSWRGMKERCTKPNNKAYHHYGGRGITYDPRWDKFENFYEDMKDTYQEGLTLDRIDVNGNYNKENCRWASWSEQQINKRS